MESNTETEIKSSTESLIGTSNSVFNSLLLLGQEVLELAHIEARLNCQNILLSVGLLFFAGMLFLSSWIALLFGAVFVLHRFGMSWDLSLLIILLSNLLLFALCIGLFKSFIKNIGFSTTLKQLRETYEEA
ncbi:MAG: hypothetical protein K0Q57_1035 [Gammaproteobacteria bacterium]|nr:hypothetical protein [Gammaproteobacteria bacterium]